MTTDIILKLFADNLVLVLFSGIFTAVCIFLTAKLENSQIIRKEITHG
jgi:hypothetical protein